MSSNTAKPFPPVHPGEILREDFMPDYGLTAYGLAKALMVPRDRIESLIREKRSITADTALRLGRYFGTTPEMWLNMQTRFDLETAKVQSATKVMEIEPVAPAN